MFISVELDILDVDLFVVLPLGIVISLFVVKFDTVVVFAVAFTSLIVSGVTSLFLTLVMSVLVPIECVISLVVYESLMTLYVPTTVGIVIVSTLVLCIDRIGASELMSDFVDVKGGVVVLSFVTTFGVVVMVIVSFFVLSIDGFGTSEPM